MSNSANILRSYVARIARLEDDKQEIVDDIKAVKLEAKGQGFDPKALTRLVKEFRMSESERAAEREYETLLELYRAAIGMLDNTPLGDAARKKMETPRASNPENSDAESKTEASSPPSMEHEFPAEDKDQARQRGRDDCAAGKKILQNPYLAGDPRRAAWDEGFCEASGSDGMDLPPAWKRKPKQKSEKRGNGAP